MDSTNLGKKIQAFRLSQGLTQEELAAKSGVSYATLTKVESGVIKNPSSQVVTKLAEALRVSLESILVIETHEGRGSIIKVLDDVYETLKESGGEVFISGIDERKFINSNKEIIEEHLRRLMDQGITERLLVREGDSFFFSGPQSEYRAVPEHLFNPTPIYVYGDKVAMIVWGPPEQVIIIKNSALADAYRKQFLFIWERAPLAHKNSHTPDERERLERSLLRKFGGRVSPIVPSDRKLFADMLGREPVTTYGNSFYYICQAANGTGSHKLGLKYYDGDTLMPIGIFNRASIGSGWHFHIIRPLGFNASKICDLSKSLFDISGNPVYVKKLHRDEREKLLSLGFASIESCPWHAEAMEEDDTFPEQILDVHATLSQADGIVKTNLRENVKRFRSRYKDKLIWSVLEGKQTAIDAEGVVRLFFEYLEMKQMHISEPSDYQNLITVPPLGSNGKSYLEEVLYIDGKPGAIIVAEKIGTDTAGLYANIALHHEYPYLSEYVMVCVLKKLQEIGVKYLNLGGSETAGLFQFKEKFQPVKYEKMHWVVYKS